MSRKYLSLAALIAALGIMSVQSVLADTITVTTFHAPSAGSYTYDVAFSATANVTNGDGFVITDFFGGVASYSFSVLDGSPPASANFTLSQPNGGSSGLLGLNGQTGNVGNTDTFTNALGVQTTINDSASVANAVFIYSGPTFIASAGSDLELTLVANDTLNTPTSTTTLGVDSSGTSGGYAFGESTALVPGVGATGPLPAPLLGGGLLIAVLFAARRKGIFA